MGLLDKTNPKATLRSVLVASATSAIVGAVVFFVAFKAQYIKAWPVTLPIWLVLCASVGAIWEWQVSNDPENDTKEE
jgi:hypothetical protein